MQLYQRCTFPENLTDSAQCVACDGARPILGPLAPPSLPASPALPLFIADKKPRGAPPAAPPGPPLSTGFAFHVPSLPPQPGPSLPSHASGFSFGFGLPLQPPVGSGTTAPAPPSSDQWFVKPASGWFPPSIEQQRQQQLMVASAPAAAKVKNDF